MWQLKRAKEKVHSNLLSSGFEISVLHFGVRTYNFETPRPLHTGVVELPEDGGTSLWGHKSHEVDVEQAAISSIVDRRVAA
jgi:hypothetical protein